MELLRVVDGEADETDGELDIGDINVTTANESSNTMIRNINSTKTKKKPLDRKSQKRELQQLNFINNNQTSPIKARARVHVDEKLQQRWKNLGSDVLTVVWRRNNPVIKKVQEIENSIDSTFVTLKSATASCRSLSDNMSSIDDSISAILEASQLMKISESP